MAADQHDDQHTGTAPPAERPTRHSPSDSSSQLPSKDPPSEASASPLAPDHASVSPSPVPSPLLSPALSSVLSPTVSSVTTAERQQQPVPSPSCDDVRPREDPAKTAKAQQIRSACIDGSIEQLEVLAESEGGFLTDDLRQMAWPVLLGIPVDGDGRVSAAAAAAAAGFADAKDSLDWRELPSHRDEEQVQLDVNRAFVHYPQLNSTAEEDRQKQALSALIVEVLRRHPFLCYFQGFHDICQVFLLVLPCELRTPAAVRLALLRIRDFMLPTIDAAVQQLQLLPDILRLADPPLWEHLRLAEHPRPFFALSGTLTMYAHDVRTLGGIARLFDILLARPPAFSLYLFAAIVCAHRKALFATPADEPEMLHHILSKLPGRAGSDGDGNDDYDDDGDDGDGDGDGGGRSPPLDTLVAAAAQLARRFPPETLPAWRSISTSSVLKTARDPAACAAAHTVADGERLFYAHVRALEHAEKRRQQRERVRQLLWQYRGPLRAVGAAVLVGLVAVWLRRSGVGGGSSSSSSSSSSLGSLGAVLGRPLSSAAPLLSRLGIGIY